MPIPQVTDRIKEAPAMALRALFAGVGQLLLAAEKVRARAMEQVAAIQRTAAPARDSTPAEPGQEAPGKPDNVRLLREAPAPDTDQDSAERLAAADRGDDKAQPATGVTARGARAPARPTAASPPPPPLPNYDDLSVASLRARLRGTDAATVGALLDYEKSHAAREAVITMFERRLAKLTEAAG